MSFREKHFAKFIYELRCLVSVRVMSDDKRYNFVINVEFGTDLTPDVGLAKYA